MSSVYILIFALLAGLLPAILWLWFWLHEDSTSPEPRGLIVKTFIAGMLVTPFVLPFQYLAQQYFAQYTIILLFLWAIVEEVFKFGAGMLAVFHRKEVDEPIDVVIYLITAALGFVAMENILFLVSPIIEHSLNGVGEVANINNVLSTVITSNLRFIGASLLHIITSAVVGIFMAFYFYKQAKTRHFYTIVGLTVAVVLHTIFNFSIIDDAGNNIFIVFFILWLAIIVLMLFFEKLKTLKN